MLDINSTDSSIRDKAATQVDVEDPESLAAYLRRRGKISNEQSIEHHILSGGVSNKTVWVALPDGREWVIKQSLCKLRVKSDWQSDPARVHQEAAGMRALIELAPSGSICDFVFEDRHQHILVMQAIPKPHENLKSLLLLGKIEQKWIDQLASILAAIHRGSFARREELQRTFADQRFFESLRREPYYAFSATAEPRARDFLTDLLAQMQTRRLALVHGDYSPKNVLVAEHGLVLLDHEVIHWGDPAFDVGFAMAHLLSKAHHLRSERARFAQAAMDFQHRYIQELGDVPWRDNIDLMAVHHTLGCLLARVVGRSPLEYLTPDEQHRQKEAVVKLMQQPPASLQTLIGAFCDAIDRQEKSDGRNHVSY